MFTLASLTDALSLAATSVPSDAYSTLLIATLSLLVGLSSLAWEASQDLTWRLEIGAALDDLCNAWRNAAPDVRAAYQRAKCHLRLAWKSVRVSESPASDSARVRNYHRAARHLLRVVGADVTDARTFMLRDWIMILWSPRQNWNAVMSRRSHSSPREAFQAVLAVAFGAGLTLLAWLASDLDAARLVALGSSSAFVGSGDLLRTILGPDPSIRDLAAQLREDVYAESGRTLDTGSIRTVVERYRSRGYEVTIASDRRIWVGSGEEIGEIELEEGEIRVI